MAPLHKLLQRKLEGNTCTKKGTGSFTLWAPGSSSPGGFFLSTNFFSGVWMRKVGFDWPALQRRQWRRFSCFQTANIDDAMCTGSDQIRGGNHFNNNPWVFLPDLTCTAWQRASRCAIRLSLRTGNSIVCQRQICAEAARELSFRPCLSRKSG